jgi:hypothetical protein
MSDDIRADYRNQNGCAAWWDKDGLWHVARPTGDGSLLWTDEEFRSRVEAVAALQKAAV